MYKTMNTNNINISGTRRYTRFKAVVKGLSAVVLASLGMQAYACGGTPFLGETCILAANFCPVGYHAADGSLLAINTNAALFSLYGTFYGGDGITTFALPDLRGRVMVAPGTGGGNSNLVIGQKLGAATTTLTVGQLPAHSHSFTGSSTALQVAVNASSAAGTANTPSTGNVPGAVTGSTTPLLYTSNHASLVPLSGATITGTTGGTIGSAGKGQPIPIQPPSLGLEVCIAMQGVFPSQN